MNTVTVKVGDELAIGDRPCPYVIRKVTKISPTGRITLDDGTILNPNLSIRGYVPRFTPSRFQPVTTAIRESINRAQLMDRLSRTSWTRQATDQLRRIVAILDEGAANGT